MDNAAFHKRKDIVEWLPPPYSPDLNSIEHKWSQAKSLKRELQFFCCLDFLLHSNLILAKSHFIINNM
jgi:transposase